MKSRFEYLRIRAKQVGIYLSYWAPGDGVKRIRFNTRDVDYDYCDGLYTALGIKEAETWLAGYIACKFERKTPNA